MPVLGRAGLSERWGEASCGKGQHVQRPPKTASLEGVSNREAAEAMGGPRGVGGGQVGWGPKRGWGGGEVSVSLRDFPTEAWQDVISILRSLLLPRWE